MVIYTDEMVRHTHPALHLLCAALRGTEAPPARNNATSGIPPSSPHPHRPQCGGGRTEQDGAFEYLVDTSARCFSSNTQVGETPSRGPPGLGPEFSSAQMGLPVPTPGCSGMQLSQYRLERLREHLRIPACRVNSSSAATHPGVPGPPGPCSTLGPGSALAAVPSATCTGPPSSLGHPISILRPRPDVPQAGDIRTMDRISFLRQALLTSRPVDVVDMLLACYRSSSCRQQEVA